mmetsp:Transcript_50378/g.90479  ORF Transcript_50378/g.90479 Transcript_50378/m.90479 type:complete len:371 (+) Transcript_50378:52-1164(+)
MQTFEGQAAPGRNDPACRRRWQDPSARCEWVSEDRTRCSPPASQSARTVHRQRRLNQNAAGSERRDDTSSTGRREHQSYWSRQSWHRWQRWQQSERWNQQNEQWNPQESGGARWRQSGRQTEATRGQQTEATQEVNQTPQAPTPQQTTEQMLEEIQQELQQLLNRHERAEASRNVWPNLPQRPDASAPGSTLLALFMTCRRNPETLEAAPSPAPVANLLGTAAMPLMHLPGGQLAYVPSGAVAFTPWESSQPMMVMRLASQQVLADGGSGGIAPILPIPVNMNQDIVFAMDSFEIIRRVSRCDKISVLPKEESCPICLEEFDVGQKSRMLPCFHCLHDRCAKRYFRSAGVQPVCPLCRFDARKALETVNV